MTENIRSAIALKICKNAAENVHSSAIGGPAWRPDLTVPWPKDRRGTDMMHLARIDFAELPSLDGFPSTGLLQIFISTEAITHGAGAEHGQGFLIEYWADPEAGLSAPQPELVEGFSEGTPLVGGTPKDTMHDNGRGLSFERVQMKRGAESNKYPDAWIGGWPLSVQDAEDRPGDVVLLQIGNGAIGEYEFMWGGDIGAATFLISPDDLANKRFDKVIYVASGY